jgi:hypothetical protein
VKLLAGIFIGSLAAIGVGLAAIWKGLTWRP